MASIEERVAYLEGKVEEHSRSVGGIREAIVDLRQHMDQRFGEVNQRFLGLDNRLAALDQKIDGSVAALDQKIDGRVAALDRKIENRTSALDDKLSRQFLWLVGIQVTTLVAIVAALVAR